MSPSFQPGGPPESTSVHDAPEVSTEQAWQAFEQQKAILDALPLAGVVVKDSRILWANHAFTALLGYSCEEARGKPFAICFADDQYQARAGQLEASLSTHERVSSDLLLCRKSGERIWSEVMALRFAHQCAHTTTLWLLTDITQRKQVEETLRRTQDRLEIAQSQALVGSWELGPDFELRYWSKQMFNLYGFDPALGTPSVLEVTERIHPDDVSAWNEAIARSIRTRSQTRVAFRTNPALGPIRHFESTQQVELDEAGHAVRTIGAVQDVTAREHAEVDLRLAQARLEAAQAHALVGSWELGPQLEARYWSKQMFTLFCFDPERGVPPMREYLDRIHPEDRTLLDETHRRSIERHEPVRVTFRSNPSLGRQRYFEATIVPEYDEHGQLKRVSGTSQDVTGRVLIEEELKLSQARLEAAQAHAKIGSWEYDPSSGSRFWSRQLSVLLGPDPDLDKPISELAPTVVHPEDQAQLTMVVERAIAQRTPQRVVYRGNPNLGVRYFEFNIVPQLDASGQLPLLTGTIQDVTEREQAAEALRDSERRMQRLLENSNDLIVILDPEGCQRSLCGPFLTMLGYEPAELEGVDIFAGMHPDDIHGFRCALRRAIAQPGTPQRVEYRYRHKLSDWVDLEAVGTSWLDDPVIQGIVVNVRQISERKQSEKERSKLQEQLHQASKMEAIGRLAGGVAHDFNNLLTVIAGNAELALEDLDSRDLLAQSLAEINTATSSAASLTRQLLAFSRRQLVEPKVVNLNELVVNLKKMLVRLIGEDIALALKLSDGLGAVCIDPGQFDQVIINLAVNARDAMPKGGELTIETSNVDLDEGYFRVHRDLKPGRFVELVVSDSGEGMTPEALSHVFEPFYTTKPLGAGTGLGLSVIFGVVKQAGGAIGAYSELGLGTTFKIYLPRVDALPQKIELARLGSEPLRGTESILVVEDNDSVRELTTTMLGRLGYRIHVASNGKAALALLRSEQLSIDLLLTDLIMPEMSGRELSDQVCRLYPGVAVLYCSGYTEDTFVRHGIASADLQFIGKPFTLQRLGLKVRQVLDARR